LGAAVDEEENALKCMEKNRNGSSVSLGAAVEEEENALKCTEKNRNGSSVSLGAAVDEKDMHCTEIWQKRGKLEKTHSR
jgi:hypothetical protein